MLSATFLEGLVQFLEQLSLVLRQAHRRFHGDVAVQVAGVARSHALDALAAQAELLAGLRAFGDVDRRIAGQRRHFDLAAERRARDGHRHHAMQVVAVAREDRVLLQADLDVQVAGRPAVGARLAVARAADAHAVVDARGDLHLERLLFLHAALAVAGGAGLGDDLARAAAMRARLLHREEALPHLHDACAVAGGAGLGLRAGLRAGAVAGVAVFPRGDANLRFLAGGCFLERDLHRVRKVRAAIDLPAPAGARPALAEDVAEDVAEGLGAPTHAFRARAAEAAAHVRVHARVAELVVRRALLGT